MCLHGNSLKLKYHVVESEASLHLFRHVQCLGRNHHHRFGWTWGDVEYMCDELARQRHEYVAGDGYNGYGWSVTSTFHSYVESGGCRRFYSEWRMAQLLASLMVIRAYPSCVSLSIDMHRLHGRGCIAYCLDLSWPACCCLRRSCELANKLIVMKENTSLL